MQAAGFSETGFSSQEMVRVCLLKRLKALESIFQLAGCLFALVGTHFRNGGEHVPCKIIQKTGIQSRCSVVIAGCVASLGQFECCNRSRGGFGKLLHDGFEFRKCRGSCELDRGFLRLLCHVLPVEVDPCDNYKCNANAGKPARTMNAKELCQFLQFITMLFKPSSLSGYNRLSILISLSRYNRQLIVHNSFDSFRPAQSNHHTELIKDPNLSPSWPQIARLKRNLPPATRHCCNVSPFEMCW